MRKLNYLFILIVYLLNNSCAQENDSVCEHNCDDESVVEQISDQRARVIEHERFGFILTTNQDDFNRDFFTATNEFILVPCNWNNSFSDNSVVIISGNKKSCCNLLSYPMERRSFGCKFEITSIKHVAD